MKCDSFLVVACLIMREKRLVHKVQCVLRIFIFNYFEGLYFVHFSMDFNNSTWVGSVKR